MNNVYKKAAIDSRSIRINSRVITNVYQTGRLNTVSPSSLAPANMRDLLLFVREVMTAMCVCVCVCVCVCACVCRSIFVTVRSVACFTY